MSVFSAAEITYLESQRLARLATAGRDCQPHVVPLAFRYNPDTDTIDVGGHNFAQRKKYRDVRRPDAKKPRRLRDHSAGSRSMPRRLRLRRDSPRGPKLTIR